MIKSKAILISYFDKNLYSIGKISANTIKKYANKNGLGFKIFQNVKISRPPAWTKIFLINYLLRSKKDYNFIIWVDADAMFVNFNKNILSEMIGDKDLYLVKHKINGKETPNTGFFVVKNTAWSKDFFNRVWKMKKYLYNNIWENAAVADLLGYKDIIVINQKREFIEMLSYKFKLRFLFNMLKKLLMKKHQLARPLNKSIQELRSEFKKNNNPLLKKVKWLDKKWNSVPEDKSSNPIIKHYPNCSNNLRLKYMKKDFENLNLKNVQ